MWRARSAHRNPSFGRSCASGPLSPVAKASPRGWRSKAAEPEFVGLADGGNRIRTIGPAEKETAVERGPAADHRRFARRPMLNDPIQLIGPASLVGNSRETFHKSGTDGSNPSSRESCELAISKRIADCLSRSRTDTLPVHIVVRCPCSCSGDVRSLAGDDTVSATDIRLDTPVRAGRSRGSTGNHRRLSPLHRRHG